MNAVMVLFGIAFNPGLTNSLTSGLMNSAQAITCDQVREKTKIKNKKAKADCVLFTHVVGVQSGSTVTTYHCGATKYELTQQEDGSCAVTTPKK